MKNIKDFLHLYLGCIIQINDRPNLKGLVAEGRKGTFVGYADYHRLDCRIAFRAGPEGRCSVFLLKPLLRPLADITNEEIEQFKNLYDAESKNILPEIKTGRLANAFLNQLSVNMTVWLLSKYFDLFNLIPDGLAIDKTTLK